MTVFDQDDLEKFVNLSKMSLNLAGFKDEKVMLNLIFDSLTEKSRENIRKLGLEEGKFTLDDLVSALNGKNKKEISLKEEFSIPQAAQETVQIYLKRLKNLLPQFGDETPSVEEFLEIFTGGLHPNLKESVRTTLLDQMKRISRRNLKETISNLEEVLKVIANSSKEKILKPRNTCYRCKSRHDPFDLEEVEGAIDDL